MLESAGSFTGTRWDRDRKHKREEILLTAEPIFRKKGYTRATIEEIARESGFSVDTISHLFQDKDGLYFCVLEQIGRRLLARLNSSVFSIREPVAALKALIRVRLYNYNEDRLFFQPFSCDGDLGVPDLARLPQSVRGLYSHYQDAVTGLFKRALAQNNAKDLNPRHLALSLEGIINAFMGYWTGPKQSDHQDQIASHICKVLLDPMGPGKSANTSAPMHPGETASRTIHISRFDLERLRELISVARCFGGSDQDSHLDELDDELAHAKCVNPREVPPDLVTMNSRVRLLDLQNGETVIGALHFPKDAANSPEGISILETLGTALLGGRPGDVIVADTAGVSRNYRIEEILYQPEAAGDFHL